jgi:pimeloyl-ACP methyl ester carboxylesterase
MGARRIEVHGEGAWLADTPLTAVKGPVTVPPMLDLYIGPPRTACACGKEAPMTPAALNATSRELRIGAHRLPARLQFPAGPLRGLVLFAHGSGSSRLSPRNRYVADALNQRGLATLLFDLLTEPEAANRANVFDIPLLGQRLAEGLDWQAEFDELAHLPTGLFGASTGAAAALVAAASRPERVAAVVSRGGRPDLAPSALPRVRAPTLLIVGGMDYDVLALNRWAAERMTCEHALQVVPGATHLFEERGTLAAVADLAGAWFVQHLRAPQPIREESHA